MALVRHLPSSLKGPRTFFTLIDKNNSKLENDWSAYKAELDQILKVLLLTKDSIVVAGSGLCTKQAFEYFSDDEYKADLFKNGYIRPAIRSQFRDFSEVYEDRVNRNTDTMPTELNDYFSSVITEIVPWNLEDNSGWYQAEFTKEAKNPNSVLRRNLRDISIKDEKLFVKISLSELEHLETDGRYFNRDVLRQAITSQLKGEARTSICQFLDLLYHISGSKVVNCENYLPQENLIYYNHASTTYGKKQIADKEIFIGCLANIILDSIYQNTFSPDVIDNLSFKDVIQLRESNASKSAAFRTKYEECLSVVQTINEKVDKEDLLKGMRELANLSEEIKSSFKKNISDELKAYKSLRKLDKKANYSVLDLAINFVGLFQLPVSVINLIFNNLSLKQIPYLRNSRKKIAGKKQNAIRSYVADYYKNDPLLLSFMEDIIEVHKENYMKVKLD